MALKFSMILEAIDRASAPAKRARSSIAGLTAGVRKWGQDVRRVSRDIDSGAKSIEHYERRARRLRQVAIGSVFRAASQQAQRFAASLRAGIRNLDLMARAGRGAKAGLGWLGGKALGLAGGALKWAAAGASAAGGLALFDLFGTASQFEQYQVMLEGTEGSAAKAKKAMAWVQKFAQTTPYELDQVMGAFVALKAYGIDPVNGSLQALGDGASGMSKSIDQAVEALADAVTGEFERLKEFGIRASKAGDKVTFSYRKNGKDIQRTVKATGGEIEKAVTGIFTDRFGGGMARQAKTMAGIMSNLKDTWNGFLLTIAQAGIFDRVKAGLEKLLAKVNEMAADGTLQAWAKKISEYLEKAWDWALKFIEETDWQQVGRDIKTVADALLIAANAIKDIATMGPQARAIFDAASGPVGWYRIYNRVSQGSTEGFGPAPVPRAKALPQSQRDRLWGGARPGRLPALAPARLPRTGTKTSAAQQVQVGGKTVIEVAVKGPGTARVVSTSSTNRNVPIQTKLGKVMAAPA